MTAVFAVTLALLSLAGVLTLLRLVWGPTTLDRIAALDVFVILLVAATSVYIAVYQDASNIGLLAAVALLAFVGQITAGRLAERWERHR